MRVAVDISDISPMRGKSRGIYTYARQLIQAMLEVLPQDCTLTILCNGESKSHFESLSGESLRIVVVHPRFPRTWQRVVWCLFMGAWSVRRHRADVFFSPKGYVPLGLKKLGGVQSSVVTIHDLIPLWYARQHPKAVGRLEKWFVNGWLVHSAQSADRVIAVSQATADAVHAETGRSDGVSVVRNAVPVLPLPTAAPTRSYILAIASLLPHKNLSGVLAAYSHYRRGAPEPLPLTICGVAAEADTLGRGVTGVIDQSPQQLADLYASARVFLFLPLIEGFGFPVAEALSLDTPVVCSDIPPLREATGGAARFVDPQDVVSCAAALLSVASEPRPAAHTPPSEHDGHGGWARCARQTWAVLQESLLNNVPAGPVRPGGLSP